MEMQMVSTANFPSGSMARNTTAAQTQDATMDSSGVPQPKTLTQMANTAFVRTSVSRSLFLLGFFVVDCSLLTCPSTSPCTFSTSFLADLYLLIFNISSVSKQTKLPKGSLGVGEFVTDNDEAKAFL